MSSIDAQIKALQLKKKKIDYIAYIVDLLKNDTKCIDFKDVKKEVVSQIEPFLKDLVSAIETDSEVKKAEGSSIPGLTPEQAKALVQVADRVLNKPEVAAVDALKQAAPKPQEVEMSPGDKISFAMDNRHLSNQRVQVINDTNAQIYGTVVGLDAPNIIVKTETGPTIKVPLNKVVPV